jgi:hypothetical protein
MEYHLRKVEKKLSSLYLPSGFSKVMPLKIKELSSRLAMRAVLLARCGMLT